MDNGYEGAVMRREGRKYKFVGYRKTSLHGLFGMIKKRSAESLRKGTRWPRRRVVIFSQSGP